VPILLTDVQTLCDSNYVNSAGVKSPDSGLRFLIYPGGSSRFTVYDGTDIQCVAAAGKTMITVTSGARAVVLQILGDEPASIARDGVVLSKAATAAQFDAADVAWRADTQMRLIFIKFPHGGGSTTIQF
jgi:hypothetical protein